MYTFKFQYTDGTVVTCEHIASASYMASGSRRNVPEDELATHCFSVSQDISLRGEGRNFSISHDGLRSIAISAE